MYLFENKNTGFFFRDDTWAIIWGNKNEMTDFDKKELSKYDPLVLIEKKRMILNFEDEKADYNAKKIIQSSFPDRKIIAINGIDILMGGGNVHCITQQQPSNQKK